MSPENRTRPVRRSAVLHLWLLCLLPLAGGCAARASTAELFPELVEHSGKKVEAVRFTGHAPFSPDTLLSLINTQPSRCSFLGLPFCVPFTRIGRQEHFLNPERVRQDVGSLARFYRAEGYFGTRVSPEVEPEGDDIIITFAIARGDPILVDLIEVTGTEGVVDPDSLERQLPLQPGDIFDLGDFAAAWDQVRRALTARGHAYAEVLRNFTVDTIDNRAVASLDAVPGPRVQVDSIIVRGAEHLGRDATLRQLPFRKGDVLRRSRLAEGQRNLYGLELVQIAAVTVAPDSLQAAPGDSTRATVLVQLAEAPVHQVDAAVGFGSVECLRTEAQWVSRSFAGGARRLAIFGSVSKIGVGEPFDIGSGDKVCTAYSDGDTALARFDYRLSADFSQPYFMGPRNQLALNVYTERLSEPQVYQRQATGARLALTRRVGDRSNVSAALDAERGVTRASPALFCAAFQFCDPTLADSLSRARFRNELSLNWTHDRTDLALNPSQGFHFRTGLDWAAPWLASEVTFVRWTGEGAIYRPVRENYVLATALRLGNFFKTASLDPQDDFLPPEERFFAGGANSVRGFDRNRLGTGVWVTEAIAVEAGDTVPEDGAQFYPTGGTSVAVASVELRFPSPFLPRLLRLAAFIDAGAVGTGSLWELGGEDWKMTPGMGLRLGTPVGPVRIDVAYNPYSAVAGPLILSDPETGTLVRVGTYQPDAPSFLRRFHFHFAIGQAF